MSEIRYIFRFDEEKESQKVFEYQLDFDDQDFSYIGKQNEQYPEWTKLDFQKCKNCPLKSDSCEYCPIAMNLSTMVEDVKEMLSYKKVTMVVATKERNFVKKTDLQSGLFSMFGLVMASSDCPHMNFLRPLARFHLPFATVDETIFRVSSMYVLSQFVQQKNEKTLKISLDELNIHYKNLEIVNSGMLNRIRSLEKGDAGKNAIVALNLFAQMFEMEFDNDLTGLQKYFIV